MKWRVTISQMRTYKHSTGEYEHSVVIESENIYTLIDIIKKMNNAEGKVSYVIESIDVEGEE